MPLSVKTISSKGQITIPKTLRQRLGIRPGDRVMIDVQGEWITIRPLRRTLVQQTAGSLRRFVKEDASS